MNFIFSLFCISLILLFKADPLGTPAPLCTLFESRLPLASCDPPHHRLNPFTRSDGPIPANVNLQGNQKALPLQLPPFHIRSSEIIAPSSPVGRELVKDAPVDHQTRRPSRQHIRRLFHVTPRICALGSRLYLCCAGRTCFLLLRLPVFWAGG